MPVNNINTSYKLLAETNLQVDFGRASAECSFKCFEFSFVLVLVGGREGEQSGKTDRDVGVTQSHFCIQTLPHQNCLHCRLAVTEGIENCYV